MLRSAYQCHSICSSCRPKAVTSELSIDFRTTADQEIRSHKRLDRGDTLLQHGYLPTYLPIGVRIMRCMVCLTDDMISTRVECVIGWVGCNTAIESLASSYHCATRDICRIFAAYTTACSISPSSHIVHWFRTGVEMGL